MLISLTCITKTGAQGNTNQPKPTPIFRNGEAQFVPEFATNWIKEELWVETNFDSDDDGKPDRMHVFVTRPSQTDSYDLKLPVVYTSSPYYGLTLGSMLGIAENRNYWNVKHELGSTPKMHKHVKLSTRTERPISAYFMDQTWVPRGYVMVYSSAPGTGLSDGTPTIGGENESLAPKCVIDWLCGRAKGYKTRTGNDEVKAFWSSGKIGMTGTSYDGTLCIAAATTGVAGLKAIIPVAPVTSFYHYYRSNGLVRSPGGYLGEDVDVLYDLINTGKKENRARNNRWIRDSILVKHADRKTGDYNEFWASRDYLKKIDNMKAAMIMAHGFNDWNVMTEHSYRFYKAAKDKGISTQLYYHQDNHGGDPPFTMMNRWFTKYLHGIDNGVELDAKVQIVREHEVNPIPYKAFPDHKSEDVTLYPQGIANNMGSLNLVPPAATNFDTIIDDYRVSGKELLEAKNLNHRLLFTTPILEKPIRISGVPRVKIKLSSNKPAANLSVWLVALPWNSDKRAAVYDNLINRGWADPQNYKSISKGELLQNGEFYEVAFDLMPDDQIIPAGRQIALLIFSSDKEFTICPKPGTQLIINLNETSLTLPIVGGLEKYSDVITK